jgi:hypothetical protein
MKKSLFVLAGVLAIVPSALAAKPVPSLTPAATQKLWRAEVARAHQHTRALSDASCRPARVVFYAQTDWLRLATKLAQSPSPCAQYYVSVPPLAADKSQARTNQAWQIRALGPQFHALDEMSWNGWSSWVSTNASTWFDAGVTARQRMAAAGFDAAAGDTWALNELSSAVRTGTGAARQNALEFMRGLSSDGVKGSVFVGGISQTTSDTSVYKVNLQNWLQDSGFWTAAASYASDWAQENYGDVRAYAVAGASPQARRDAEAQYLGHELALANAGPDAVAQARSFLQSSYVAFGNAAWAWSSAYGWTAAPSATMQDFVSGQIYAARSLGAPSGVDRLGFAWAPSNTQGLATTDFNAQTASILDRIANAVRDSGVPADDPGSAACAPAWCTTALDGAAFTTAWQSFATWSQPGLVLTSAPATFAAGGSMPVTAQIQTAGVAQNATADQSVTFASSSPHGGFATTAGGPWTATLSATIPTGSSSVSVYYSDTLAGSATISAALPGQAAAAQTETVTAAPLAKLAVSPAAATVLTNRSRTFTASGTDGYGNSVTVTPTWTLSTPYFGRLATASGASTTFTAANRAGSVTLTASSGGVRGSAAITVTKR